MKNEQIRGEKRNFLKVVFGCAALVGLMTLSGTPVVKADNDDCQLRITKADHKLHEAAEHHGWNSKRPAH